jgi:hypothetical protein
MKPPQGNILATQYEPARPMTNPGHGKILDVSVEQAWNFTGQ